MQTTSLREAAQPWPVVTRFVCCRVAQGVSLLQNTDGHHHVQRMRLAPQAAEPWIEWLAQHLCSNRGEGRETSHWWMIAAKESRPDEGLLGAKPTNTATKPPNVHLAICLLAGEADGFSHGWTAGLDSNFAQSPQELLERLGTRAMRRRWRCCMTIRRADSSPGRGRWKRDACSTAHTGYRQTARGRSQASTHTMI